jgi:hypothetical protein
MRTMPVNHSSGTLAVGWEPLVSGAKRTLRGHSERDAIDPQATSADHKATPHFE